MDLTSKKISRSAAVPLTWFPVCGVVVFSFISYAPMSWLQRIILGFTSLAVLIPLYLALLPSRGTSEKAPWEREASSWSAPLLSLLVLISFALRFVDLTGLNPWPCIDEGVAGWYALRVLETGKIQWIYNYIQYPSAFVLSLSAFFQCWGVSLTSLWGWSAVCSSFIALMSYPVARSWGASVSCAVWFMAVVGTCFWTIYMCRFCLMSGCFTLAWMMIFLYAAGQWYRSERPEGGWSYGTGLATGAGVWGIPYTLGWLLGIALTAIVFFRRAPKAWTRFGVGFLILSAPLIWVYLQQGIGDYIGAILAKPSNHPTQWWKGTLIPLTYLSAPFWGVGAPGFHFGPFQGGFLNPFWTIFSIMGSCEMWRFRDRPMVRGGIVLLFLGWLPGLLSTNLEMFRIAGTALPLLALAAVGVNSWAERSGRGLHRWLLVGLALSILVDAHHLWGPFHRWGSDPQNQRSAAHVVADGVLREESHKQGPGLLLLDFLPKPDVTTLTVSTYEFNAARNPRWKPADSHWVAILVPEGYRSYLDQRYPGGRWTQLPVTPKYGAEPLVLGILPAGVFKKETLSLWIDAQEFFQKQIETIWDARSIREYETLISMMVSYASRVSSDRFMTAVLWEKVAEIDLDLMNAEAHKKGSVDHAVIERLLLHRRSALRHAQEDGIPAPHLSMQQAVIDRFLRENRAVTTLGDH